MNRFAENIYEGRGGNFSKAFLSGIGFLKKKKNAKQTQTRTEWRGSAKAAKNNSDDFFFLTSIK